MEEEDARDGGVVWCVRVDTSTVPSLPREEERAGGAARGGVAGLVCSCLACDDALSLSSGFARVIEINWSAAERAPLLFRLSLLGAGDSPAMTGRQG